MHDLVLLHFEGQVLLRLPQLLRPPELPLLCRDQCLLRGAESTRDVFLLFLQQQPRSLNNDNERHDTRTFQRWIWKSIVFLSIGLACTFVVPAGPEGASCWPRSVGRTNTPLQQLHRLGYYMAAERLINAKRLTTMIAALLRPHAHSPAGTESTTVTRKNINNMGNQSMCGRRVDDPMLADKDSVSLKEKRRSCGIRQQDQHLFGKNFERKFRCSPITITSRPKKRDDECFATCAGSVIMGECCVGDTDRHQGQYLFQFLGSLA